ncbi:MAG: hypothetical protein COA50_15910 [Flavobacteriaceae bacterium]|nr:MAG: hypothetical protein COA50_15910 [Flavobacteriaceae bacterium]
MILTLIRYSILFLILWYLPSFLLAYVSSGLGSLSSYATSLLLIAYFFLSKERRKPLLVFVALGLSYFLISAINYTEIDVNNYFIKEFIRFMIVVICGAAVLYQTRDKEIFYILLIGASSIIINAVFLPSMQLAIFGESYGRFSGFYLNPNLAGSICLLGYSLSHAIKNIKWKIIGQIVFTLAGLLTLSRTFIAIWLLLTIISIYYNRKNIIAPIIGALLLILIFTFSGKLTLNAERFQALQGVLGQEKGNTQMIGEDTRNDTWSIYYNLIFDKPFVGHGFRKFQMKAAGLPGVHNSYLMTIGEAGIIPFLLIVGIYLYLLIKSYLFIRSHPWYFYLSLTLVFSMMGGHGYFYNFVSILLSMYVFIKLKDLSSIHTSEIEISNNINH